MALVSWSEPILGPTKEPPLRLHEFNNARGIAKCVIMRTCELAAQVANMCRQLSVSLGLRVAGIDLRRTPDGRWYCFEANPSPGFTFYAAQTMQPIGAAIASLLVRLDGAH